MATLKVEVMRDFWDENGDRVAAGTIVDLDHALAAKFLKSGVVDIVVPAAGEASEATSQATSETTTETTTTETTS